LTIIVFGLAFGRLPLAFCFWPVAFGPSFCRLGGLCFLAFALYRRTAGTLYLVLVFRLYFVSTVSNFSVQWWFDAAFHSNGARFL
jgi:hypothetical protein